MCLRPIHLMLTALLILAATLPGQQAAAPGLLHDFQLPSGDELSWRAIPWRDSFAAGVLDADKADKPVLLWAMNGHPLGCT